MCHQIILTVEQLDKRAQTIVELKKPRKTNAHFERKKTENSNGEVIGDN
jgi:hypothetical protein